MKKLILIVVLMLVSSSVFAQDIFGPPNYFFKRNDSVFVRPGSVFGSASSVDAYTKTQSDARYLFKDSTNIAYKNQINTFTTDNKFAGHIGIGSSGVSPIPWVVVGLTIGDSNMVGFNLVNTTLNQTRSSQEQATDTSSASLRLTRWTGKPQLDFVDNTGFTIFKIDSTGRTTVGNTVVAPSFTSGSGGGFQATASGIFYFTGRSVMKSPADGVITFTNNAETSFVSAIFGTGNFTAGFIRGTVDTDITAPFFRSPNGTLYYLLVSDVGVLTTSTTAP